MFDIPSLFSIVLKHANKTTWSDRKKVSVGLSLVLHEDSLAYLADTSFNKLFTGQNKGRTLYGIVQDEITEKGFSSYIFQAEKRLSDTNYKENKFLLADVLEDFFELIEESQNLSKSVLLGLKQSYKLNHQDRPYLFLAECLFYALTCQHNKQQQYIEPDFSQETEVISKPLEELVSRANGYSKRITQDLNRFSEEELQLFRKIAPFTFYDNSFDEFSGEAVLDHYLISHADFLDLFTKYGVKGNEVSRLIEYGLISGGGRHEIIVEKGELSGFQNDNLVLTFTTESDERITFEYSAFHLTDTAKALIEILEIETNDDFFRELGEEFKNRVKVLPIDIEILGVDDF
ncbi:MAG: hypothetical protein Q4A23_03315 [bacterium]|nr:hypothetical protein [bacterium]